MPGVPSPLGPPIVAPHGRYYTAQEIADLARDAGFRDDEHPSTRASELAVAVAIALAESGGDSQAVGPAPYYCKGLWQICPAGENMFDPALNAQTAYAKYTGAGKRFTAWTTYTNKTYLVKLPVAEAAVRATHRDRPGFTGGGGKGFVHDLISFTGDIGHDLAAFFGWITSGETWIRLGEVLGGAILLILAMLLLGKFWMDKTEMGQQAKTAVTKGAL